MTQFVIWLELFFGTVILLVQKMICTVCRKCSKVERYGSHKDIRSFYEGGLYHLELLFFMAWVIASFSVQLQYLVDTNDLMSQVEEAQKMQNLKTCSSALVSLAIDKVSQDFYLVETENLKISIILCSVCLPLWFLLWHSNANFILEQVDLSEEHFPPPVHAPPKQKKDDHNYLPEPEKEPEKPKPAAVTQNAMLLELQQRIQAVKEIQNKNPSDDMQHVKRVGLLADDQKPADPQTQDGVPGESLLLPDSAPNKPAISLPPILKKGDNQL